MLSRRDLLRLFGQTGLAPLGKAWMTSSRERSLRCANVVSLLRGVEPRGPMDLFLPLQRQMETIKAHQLPATWLLLYDALVSDPFVAYLKAQIPGPRSASGSR